MIETEDHQVLDQALSIPEPGVVDAVTSMTTFAVSQAPSVSQIWYVKLSSPMKIRPIRSLPLISISAILTQIHYNKYKSILVAMHAVLIPGWFLIMNRSSLLVTTPSG